MWNLKNVLWVKIKVAAFSCCCDLNWGGGGKGGGNRADAGILVVCWFVMVFL